MSDAFYPFTPKRLAELAAFSESTRAGTGAPPPIGQPLVVTEDGTAWLPVAGVAGAAVGYTLRAGLSLRWAPAPELGGAILELGAGRLDDDVDAFAVVLSAAGLRKLAADLAAIADQVESA